ncbi:Hypothetical protein OINT_1001763 [Brucella intermedia LMG 3301]|uniref:Uncharacterized protein n=1 Tax=Brucella intermedia LMG 3301 TaxID=641118 RepID=C4WG30_9HYPH|nr:hypothetical protein [Brucella intermedia]EEQ96337.1 Hypothetical protein OINT_1001763 [Brucella intermedia LMG 3301]NKB95737.1 hypothetical protein [Brucella intermedia]SUB13322.1 Uncharacterised protein [Brucella intermedia]
MAVKSRFEVTEKAGTFVAGERNPGAGKPISLTEDQAYYPLIAGEIRRPGTVVEADPAAGKPKKA